MMQRMHWLCISVFARPPQQGAVYANMKYTSLRRIPRQTSRCCKNKYHGLGKGSGSISSMIVGYIALNMNAWYYTVIAVLGPGIASSVVTTHPSRRRLR